jgi:hypothetical protein
VTPFLSLYTPTYRRPQALARCLASVSAQTLSGEVEQVVIPDHVGRGIAGMFAQVPSYAPSLHGEYVAWLCDDDVLAHPTVVWDLKQVIDLHRHPELLIVDTMKDGARWPAMDIWPPQCGAIDLNCAVMRRDVWLKFAASYGACYEGDYLHFKAMADAGVRPIFVPLLFSVGAVSRGAAEAA